MAHRAELCPGTSGTAHHSLCLCEGRTETSTTGPVAWLVSGCHLQGWWDGEVQRGNALTHLPFTECGPGLAELDGEVAHASGGGHLHHSPSQESDFNATKQPQPQPPLAIESHSSVGVEVSTSARHEHPASAPRSSASRGSKRDITSDSSTPSSAPPLTHSHAQGVGESEAS